MQPILGNDTLTIENSRIGQAQAVTAAEQYVGGKVFYTWRLWCGGYLGLPMAEHHGCATPSRRALSRFASASPPCCMTAL